MEIAPPSERCPAVGSLAHVVVILVFQELQWLFLQAQVPSAHGLSLAQA